MIGTGGPIHKVLTLRTSLKLILLGASFGIYSLMCWIFSRIPDAEPFLFSLIPVFSATLFWGFTGGIAAAVIITTADLLLLRGIFAFLLPANIGQIGPALLALASVLLLTGYLRKWFLLHSQKEKLLRDSELEYRTIVSNAKSVIVKYDTEGRIIFFNEYAENLFGYTHGSIYGRRGIDTINKPSSAEELEGTERMLRELLTNTEKYAYNENWNYKKNGLPLWMAWTNAPLYNNEGEKIAIICIGNDITEQKKAEATILQNLEEKKVLLREIHHRVKNNLQIVSSILSLQSPYISNGKDKSIFKNCENRITSMALIHEQLYQSDNLSKIEISRYIQSLLDYLADAYDSYKRNIQTDLFAEEIYMDIDSAIPCGLIITELTTNSLKHAFPNASKGRIQIRLELNDERVRIELRDNGKGLHNPSEWKKRTSLGLQLVDALCSQLNAEVSVSSETGTLWNISIPVAKG